MPKSLYETIGVSEGTPIPEVKKAYKKLAKIYHPDINKDPKAEEKFKEINAAYDILSDPQKKAQYDQYGDSMFGGQSFHDFSQTRGGVDINDIINQVFGGGFGGAGRSQRGGFGGGFDDMFGGGQAQAPNLDTEVEAQVTLEDAILGATRTISMQGTNFDIKIPAGIQTGQKLRVKGKGRQHGSRVGDLFVKVKILPSSEYEKDGFDLYKTVDVSLRTALFGGKIDVKTLYKNIQLKIPENTKQLQQFRLREYGIINQKTKTYGDLYVKANIVLPKLDELDADLVEALNEKLPK